MKAKEFANATADELVRHLEQQRAELRTLRSQLASNQLADVRAVRKTRKRIARIQTWLRQRNERTSSTVA